MIGHIGAMLELEVGGEVEVILVTLIASARTVFPKAMPAFTTGSKDKHLAPFAFLGCSLLTRVVALSRVAEQPKIRLIVFAIRKTFDTNLESDETFVTGTLGVGVFQFLVKL